MGRFVKGDIVVVPFPFSDLTRMKRRPALVLAVLDGDDIILRHITSHTLLRSKVGMRGEERGTRRRQTSTRCIERNLFKRRYN